MCIRDSFREFGPFFGSTESLIPDPQEMPKIPAKIIDSDDKLSLLDAVYNATKEEEKFLLKMLPNELPFTAAKASLMPRSPSPAPSEGDDERISEEFLFGEAANG